MHKSVIELPQHWSPPEWSLCCFPLPEEAAEVVTLSWLVPALHAILDTSPKADTPSFGMVLHVCHMLVTRQGVDGRWPAAFNARTGEVIGEGLTFAPVPLFLRVNAMLNTTEFDSACTDAEAGGYTPSVELKRVDIPIGQESPPSPTKEH
jgi:hypothetical protein